MATVQVTILRGRKRIPHEVNAVGLAKVYDQSLAYRPTNGQSKGCPNKGRYDDLIMSAHGTLIKPNRQGSVAHAYWVSALGSDTMAR